MGRNILVGWGQRGWDEEEQDDTEDGMGRRDDIEDGWGGEMI